MIYLELNKIVQGDIEEPIEKWEVWFYSPLGPTPDREQAIKACKTLDLDATSIFPVPVAISKSTYEMAVK